MVVDSRFRRMSTWFGDHSSNEICRKPNSRLGTDPLRCVYNGAKCRSSDNVNLRNSPDSACRKCVLPIVLESPVLSGKCA